MSRVKIENTDGTITRTGTWVLAAGATGFASGNSFDYSVVAGSVYTIPVPSGKTCVLLGGSCRPDGFRGNVVRLDGVVHGTWDQYNYQTSAWGIKYQWWRTLYQPIFVDPATTHTITITVGGTGVIFELDFVEFYVAESQIAGRMTSFGHSMLYGVTSSVSLGPQSGRFTTRLASYLTSTNYQGASWTDDNQGVPSEDLTNGSYQSGVTGGLTQYTTDNYYNNSGIFTPGWMRAEAGDLWPAATPALGSGLFTTAAQYNQGGEAQWAFRRFAVGVLKHAENDYGYGQIYSTLGFPIPAAARDAAGDTTLPVVADAGFGVYEYQRYLQRKRELYYRVMANITPVPRIYDLGSFNILNGAAHPAGHTLFVYDNGIRAMLRESWAIGQPFYYVDCYPIMTGAGPVNVSSSDFHPNDEGHRLVFEAIRRQHEVLLYHPSGSSLQRVA